MFVRVEGSKTLMVKSALNLSESNLRPLAQKFPELPGSLRILIGCPQGRDEG
jgi:hypothetical protein